LTRQEIAALEQAIVEEVRSEYPQTVRHVFYRLCHLDTVGKSENGYRRIQRLVLKLRKEGRLRYSWIADGTRFRIKPQTYDSVADAIHETARFYRRSLWRDSDVYVEVWCESDSIAGVLRPVTEQYDISLMSSRGFSSHTFLYRAAVEMSHIGKPVFVYYVGDWDPSGQLIGQHVIDRLREFAPRVDIQFERLLINPDQIEDFELPTKPVKCSTHSRNFRDTRAVEAEAMPAGQTREILEDAILCHVSERELDVIEIAEAEEKSALEMFQRKWQEEQE
jgi:hypothetical protein